MKALEAAHQSHEAWIEFVSDPDQIAKARPAEAQVKFQAMMHGGCRTCPAAQTRVCQNLEKPFGVLGHDFISGWKTMPWQFKAEDVFAGGASDGSIPHEEIQAVMRSVEDFARERGDAEVSMGDLVEGMFRLIRSLDYVPAESIDPAFARAVESMGSPSEVIARGKLDGRERAGAFRRNPEAMARNGAELMMSLPHERRIHEELADRPLNWCAHLPHLWSRLLSRVELTDEQLDEALSLSESIASERNHPGVTPRDAETALLRAAAAGLRAG